MAYSIRNNLIAAALCCAALLGAQNKIPEKDNRSYFRLDINAIPNRLVLKGLPQKESNVHNSSWYREDARFAITAAGKEPLREEWTEYSVTFVPNRSGEVWIRISGLWRKEDELRPWVMVDSVRLNGKLLENGDFSAYSERQPEIYRPDKWILQHRAEFYIDGGRDKSPACLVNHDSPIVTSFQVRAGEPNTVSVVVKQPRRGIIPKFEPPKRIQDFRSKNSKRKPR